MICMPINNSSSSIRLKQEKIKIKSSHSRVISEASNKTLSFRLHQFQDKIKAMTLLSLPLASTPNYFPCAIQTYQSHGFSSVQTRLYSLPFCSCHDAPAQREQAKGTFQFEEKTGRRRLFFTFLAGLGAMSAALPSFGKTKKQTPFDERRLLEQNKRIQRENNVPDDFPSFLREGFTVKVVAADYYVKRDSGLMLWDVALGQGDCPKDGQQVTFHYIGYNESGRRIDSTYLQGAPAKVRLGNNALIPGFEEGIKDMKPGGKRRIIVPPELGPPVGPSTFFSAKQFEVFDIELLSIQDCTRRTIAGFYSDVVCT